MSGDRSVTLWLDMVEDAQAQFGRAATKDWASDHCNLIAPADVQRAAKLGVQFSCFPNAVNNAGRVARQFGDEVAHTYIAPLKSMIDAGMRPAYEGEGAPHVWAGLYAYITRKDRDGIVWGAQEKIDRATALKFATIWAAEYVLKPDKLGSIEPGKLADLVVLDKDFMTIPDEEIPNIRPQVTVVDGKIVFVHSQFAEEYSLRPAGAAVSTYEELIKRQS